MKTLHVYSSRPADTQLAAAFIGILALGVEVELRPLAEYPTKPAPRRRVASLRVESCEIGVRLRAIGERLDDHFSGARRLLPNEREELVATRDALAARRRRIEELLQEGGQGNG